LREHDDTWGMLTLVASLFAFSCSPSASAARAVGDLQAAALREVDTVQNLFQAIYAPAELKRKLFLWDLNREADRARTAILAAHDGDLLAYQRALRDFFKAPHDYHARILFADPETSSLPFRVKRAEGKYLVTAVDASKFPNGRSPLQVGDEILTFGGQPIDFAVQAVKAENPAVGLDAADQSLAEYALTTRKKAKLMNIPLGDIAITGTRGPAGDRFGFTATWEHSAPAFSPIFQRASAPEIRHDTRFPLDGAGALPAPLGDKHGPLPDLGPVTWRAPANSPFRAYEFTSGKQRVGYIRIADFEGDLARVNEFAKLIARMENDTDVLVLDQLDNPGGQSYYLDALVSLLSPAPVKTAPFRSAIDSGMYAGALGEREKILGAHGVAELQKALGKSDYNGYPVDLAFGDSLARYDAYLVSEWRAGRRVSDPHYRRVETIAPRAGATPYSKPILLLANELDFSCADMFPALLQDRERVKVFGATTAGAGGNNDDLDALPNLLGIQSYSITVSSELRPDGSYLENAGMTPDIPYTLTLRDLRENYVEYVRAVNDALDTL
jgi:hypothetical protein